MLYDIGFFIFSIIYLPVLIFKGKLHREFPERFGRYDKAKERALLSGSGRIWIQAVSVGEVALCKSLIPLLKEKFSADDLVISTITRAGNDLAKRLFSKEAIVIYFPLDFAFTVKRAVEFIKPRIYIMIETEIWPNLLKELSLNSVPSILINGRISDRSIGKYRLVKPYLKNALRNIRVFCMQDIIDGMRITELGAPSDRVKVTGNMKFDIEAPVNILTSDAIRRSFGVKTGDELFVAGSTHSGEEEIIVEAFKELAFEFPRLKLLIAPRHIERVEEVEKIIRKSGFQSTRISRLNDKRYTIDDKRYTINDKRIMILDTYGCLNDAYLAATIVFIGGSLIKHGGQNPIEPAVSGRAILFGPHMFNFKYVTNVLLREEAALLVSGKEELIKFSKMLLRDVSKRSKLGDNAKRIVADNRGATKKNFQQISEILR
ncbi:MAG: 3-deoxy-D-manno-octulosonic acid transferase [Candidatus Omnitrophota bacterium]|nr:3-deoxy-D-manno-octulosonic acid transferase [Candidatus Omnitrophota bacterium]